MRTTVGRGRPRLMAVADAFALSHALSRPPPLALPRPPARPCPPALNAAARAYVWKGGPSFPAPGPRRWRRDSVRHWSHG
ncbi:hypothetical protein GCM10009654_40680 [Streptomyces hebeiensis]|uniref:Uncharacterized protein n=1 Tax=Streptomyces hebeiensis TaxID=229486 RepID=A0ABN1V008_9ACTN